MSRPSPPLSRYRGICLIYFAPRKTCDHSCCYVALSAALHCTGTARARHTSGAREGSRVQVPVSSHRFPGRNCWPRLCAQFVLQLLPGGIQRLRLCTVRALQLCNLGGELFASCLSGECGFERAVGGVLRASCVWVGRGVFGIAFCSTGDDLGRWRHMQPRILNAFPRKLPVFGIRRAPVCEDSLYVMVGSRAH